MNKPCYECKNYKKLHKGWCLKKRTFTEIARITNDGRTKVSVDKLIECWSV